MRGSITVECRFVAQLQNPVIIFSHVYVINTLTIVLIFTDYIDVELKFQSLKTR